MLQSPKTTAADHATFFQERSEDLQPEGLESGPVESPERATDINSRNTGLFVSSRDEMNLAEFPLAVLSTRSNPDLKTLEFRDSHRAKNGELVEREWIITGADKFGLPTSTDDDVVLGLICLTMDQGFRDRKVFFTRYELLRVLRWSTEGRSYQRINKSLDRLSGVRIRATNAFFDNSMKGYQTVNFGIIDAYEINDERNHDDRRDGAGNPNSYFIWSEVIFDSFRNGFIKKIDLDYYFSLKTAVARRLYRYLDKHFYYRPVIERPLMLLAFEKLGLSRNYKYVSSVKQQLEPALAELIETGYLQGAEFLGRGNATTIRFTVGKGKEGKKSRSAPAQDVPTSGLGAFQRAVESSTPTPAPSRIPLEEMRRRSVLEMLISRGLSRGQVEQILKPCSIEMLSRIEQIIAYYDHLEETKGAGAFRNGPGFLYSAICSPEQFTIPQSFLVSRGLAASASAKAVAGRGEGAQARADRAAAAEAKSEQLQALQKHYRAFRDGALLEVRASLDSATLEGHYQRVREKLSCLRGVLEKARFDEAVEGCVNDELAKIYSIASEQEWIKQQTSAPSVQQQSAL